MVLFIALPFSVCQALFTALVARLQGELVSQLDCTVWDRSRVPRLLLFAFRYILLLLDTKGMVAAKIGISLLPYQHKLQAS
jgi:hypothetical protein